MDPKTRTTATTNRLLTPSHRVDAVASGRITAGPDLQVPTGQQYQEQQAMTGVLPESLVTRGVRSLEMRWIFPGQMEAAVARWFGRFPAGTESREDTYLLDPQLPWLSVKVRGGGALEVKAYRGSPGILEVTPEAALPPPITSRLPG